MLPFSVFSLGDTLLISIQEEIDDASIALLFETVTDHVQTSRANGVILDLHDVEVVDSYLARHLEELAACIRLMQAVVVVVVGLSVPVVMTLLDFGIELKGLEFALDVEQAMLMLGQEAHGRSEAEF